MTQNNDTSQTPPGLSHVDATGRAHMVDVSSKSDTLRVARAEGFVACAQATLEAIAEDRTPKGAVIATAEIAGIMAAKRTSDLIPMCHGLNLSHVRVRILPDKPRSGLHISAEVRVLGPTGVEMEALTAVSLAALTLYDMLKAIDRGLEITGIHLTHKSGGKTPIGTP